MSDITILLPIHIKLGVKKETTFALNLNTYRNAHYQILNNAKVLYEKLVEPLIKNLPQMARVELTYKLFFGSKRRIDIANICCIVDKFFCDALVKGGKLPDDSQEFISDLRYVWGGIDIQDPRVEVTLSSIELLKEPQNQDIPMQISFSHSEIREALVEYLEKQITLIEGQRVELAFDFDDPKEIIAYLDVLRDGQKAQGMPLKSEPEKTITNTPRTGESETQTAARRTRGPNKPKTSALAEAATETAALDEPVVVETRAAISSGEERVDPQVQEVAAVEAAAIPIPPFLEQADVPRDPEPAPEPAKVAAFGNSIFPSAASSAPVLTPATVPVAAGNAKSLFANLVRPNNSPSTTH